MGQYYKPIVLKDNNRVKNPVEACLTSWDFNNGAKLMEHSYVNNDLVSAFEGLIYEDPDNFLNNGLFTGKRVAWSGDYADPYKKDGEDNLYGLASEDEVSTKSKKFAAMLITKLENGKLKSHRYIINHTKHLYIDITKLKKNKWDMTIHPLPILISDGNGRGGGDYHGTAMDMVGKWYKNRVVVSDTIKHVQDKYKEIEVHFDEECD